MAKVLHSRQKLFYTSIIIEFKEMSDGYPDDADRLNLRVNDAGGDDCISIFDFGSVEGMMVLDTDRQRLVAICFRQEGKEKDEEPAAVTETKRKAPPFKPPSTSKMQQTIFHSTYEPSTISAMARPRDRRGSGRPRSLQLCGFRRRCLYEAQGSRFVRLIGEEYPIQRV